jgi:hypothetical protein
MPNERLEFDQPVSEKDLVILVSCRHIYDADEVFGAAGPEEAMAQLRQMAERGGFGTYKSGPSLLGDSMTIYGANGAHELLVRLIELLHQRVLTYPLYVEATKLLERHIRPREPGCTQQYSVCRYLFWRMGTMVLIEGRRRA